MHWMLDFVRENKMAQLPRYAINVSRHRHMQPARCNIHTELEWRERNGKKRWTRVRQRVWVQRERIPFANAIIKHKMCNNGNAFLFFVVLRSWCTHTSRWKAPNRTIHTMEQPLHPVHKSSCWRVLKCVEIHENWMDECDRFIHSSGHSLCEIMYWLWFRMGIEFGVFSFCTIFPHANEKQSLANSVFLRLLFFGI